MAGLDQFIAPPGKRLAAAATDLMFVFALAMVLMPGLALVGIPVKQDVMLAVTYLLFESFFLWLWKGQTPGRRLMDIFVLPGKGGELSLRHAIMRPGVRVLLFLATFEVAYIWRYWDYDVPRVHALIPIEVAMLLTMPMRRTVADMVSGTLVLNAPPPQPHRAPAAPMYSAADGEFGVPARPPGHRPDAERLGCSESPGR